MDTKQMIEVLAQIESMAKNGIDQVSIDDEVLEAIREKASGKLIELIDLYFEESEKNMPETWLERLKQASEALCYEEDRVTPSMCLGLLLGYECMHKKDGVTCLGCWKTPVDELGSFRGDDK